MLLDENNEDADSEISESYSRLGSSVRWADIVLFQSLDDDKPQTMRTEHDISSFGSVMLEVPCFSLHFLHFLLMKQLTKR